MATKKASLDKLGFDLEIPEDIPRAKRDMVIRFVKDQEALQTSQVDLKIVDDETIDLIHSAGLVVKGEETKRANNREDELREYQHQPHRTLTNEVSSLNLDDGKKTSESREPVIVPRPPSGRPRSRSVSGRKKVTSSRRKYSEGSSQATTSSANNFPSRDDDRNEAVAFRREIRERTEVSSSPDVDDEGSGMNLNASWPQNFLSKKFSIPLRKHSANNALHGKESTALNSRSAALENFSGIDNHSEAYRPRSSQCFQQVQRGEILTARISSANECERISCDAASLTKPSTYVRKLHKSSRRRAYINFNRLDAQLSFEGPLELEPVHPSDIPLYSRSGSAASSTAPYTLVHVPPIGREGPAPSSS